MIRIDLLPDYVAKRRLTAKLILLFVVLFISITAGLLAYNFVILVPQADQQEALATQDESIQKQIAGLNSKATSTKAQIQPITTKLNFVKAVAAYNRSWVLVYDQLARYTDPKLSYASAAVSGSTMSISAYTPSIDEVGRYLMRMYEEPDFNTVTIDHLPGYPESVVNKYFLYGRLIAVGSLDGLTPKSSGQGNSGQGGGPRQVQSQGISRPGGSNNSSSNSGPAYGSVIDPSAAVDVPTWSMDAAIDRVVSPLATGSQVGRLRSIVRQKLLRQVVVKQQIRGFQVSVTATLKSTFSPPPVPSAFSAPSSGGPGGASN